MTNVTTFAGFNRAIITPSGGDDATVCLIEGVLRGDLAEERTESDAFSGSSEVIATLLTAGKSTLTLSVNQTPPELWRLSGGKVIVDTTGATGPRLHYPSSQLIKTDPETPQISSRSGSAMFFEGNNAGDVPADVGHISFYVQMTQGTTDYTFSSVKVWRVDGGYIKEVANGNVPDVGFLNRKLVYETTNLNLTTTSHSLRVDGLTHFHISAYSTQEKNTDIGKFSQGGQGETVGYFVDMYESGQGHSVLRIPNGGIIGKRPFVSLMLVGDTPEGGSSRTVLFPTVKLKPMGMPGFEARAFTETELEVDVRKSGLIGGYTHQHMLVNMTD
jgi:hypothetical protein